MKKLIFKNWKSILQLTICAVIIFSSIGISKFDLNASAQGPTNMVNDYETVNDIKYNPVSQLGGNPVAIIDQVVKNTGNASLKVSYTNAMESEKIHLSNNTNIDSQYDTLSFWIKSEVATPLVEIAFYANDTAKGVEVPLNDSLMAGESKIIKIKLPKDISLKDVRISLYNGYNTGRTNSLWIDTLELSSEKSGINVEYGKTAKKNDITIQYELPKAGYWFGLFDENANIQTDTPIAYREITDNQSGSIVLGDLKADIAEGHYIVAMFTTAFASSTREVLSLKDVYTAEVPKVFLSSTNLKRKRINPEIIGRELGGKGYETEELVITYVNANMPSELPRGDEISLYPHRVDEKGNTMYSPNIDNSLTNSGRLDPKHEQKAIGQYKPNIKNLLDGCEYVVYYWDGNYNNGFYDFSKTFTITKVTASTEKPIAPSNLIYNITAKNSGEASGTVSFNKAADESKLDEYSLYWGDDNGKLSNYATITSLPKTEKNLKFTFGENVIIPKGATRLLACSKNQTKDSDLIAINIPEDKRNTFDDEKLYSFQVMSDVHVLRNNNRFQNENFDMALKKIKNLDPSSKGIVIAGDLVENGSVAEYENYVSILEKNKEGLPPVYESIGNHELVDGNSQFILKTLVERFVDNTDTDSVYYSTKIGDASIIVLGTDTPENPTTGVAPFFKALISDKQLTWFEKELEKNNRDGIPSFVFLHQPIRNSTGGSYVGVFAQGADVPIETEKRILNAMGKYQNSFFMSGHTHWSLTSSDPMHIRKGTNGANDIYMFNDGSFSAQETDEGVSQRGVEGYFVEVYKNKVLIRGYDYKNDLWLPTTQFKVDLKGVQEEIKPDYAVTIPASTNIEANAEKTALNGDLYASKLNDGGKLKVTVTAGKLFNQNFLNDETKALPYNLQSDGKSFAGIEIAKANVKTALDININALDWNKAYGGTYKGLITFHVEYQSVVD